MKKLNKWVSIVFFVVSYNLSVNAQQAFLSSGGDISGAGGFVAYSVGQVGYTNYSGSDGSIHLGVQQPNVVIMVGTEDHDITLAASVYPNPANTFIQITVDDGGATESLKDLSFTLFDIGGNLLLQQEIFSTITTIPMESRPSSLYILKIARKETELKTFKIFKTH